MSSNRGFAKRATRIQRMENLIIAILIAIGVLYLELPLWVLLAAFLVFDISALGYAWNARVGALMYNLVHNYAGPAILGVVYLALRTNDGSWGWLALLAASWAFHVALDRALGYGLKLHDFAHTHLGRIGKDDVPNN